MSFLKKIIWVNK